MTKNILMVVALKDFRDEEYFVPRDIFVKQGFAVTTASSHKQLAVGVLGGEVGVDITLMEVRVIDYDAVVLVGGGGALGFVNDLTIKQVLVDFLNSGKVVSAICIAPVILARAGVLSGKRATVWVSDLNKMGEKELQLGGAIVSSSEVEVDGLVVTANGPDAAQEFAERIVSLLK